VDSPSPLEYASDADADGEVDTNNSYVTPVTSSPTHEEPIVADNNGPGESAEDRLAEAGTLVPIEETVEVLESESSEAPEENEEPLQTREPPPAYFPVRRGQRSMRGGRVAGPHAFCRHCFPYLANPDPESYPKYFRWEIAPAKRRRTSDDWGREDDRTAKRARIDDVDVQHESHRGRPWPSPRSSRRSSDSPDARTRASDCKWGIGFSGDRGDGCSGESS